MSWGMSRHLRQGQLLRQPVVDAIAFLRCQSDPRRAEDRLRGAHGGRQVSSPSLVQSKVHDEGISRCNTRPQARRSSGVVPGSGASQLSRTLGGTSRVGLRAGVATAVLKQQNEAVQQISAHAAPQEWLSGVSPGTIEACRELQVLDRRPMSDGTSSSRSTGRAAMCSASSCGAVAVMFVCNFWREKNIAAASAAGRGPGGCADLSAQVPVTCHRGMRSSSSPVSPLCHHKWDVN
eukprot:6486326-Prymnesium_polylepis.1